MASHKSRDRTIVKWE